jgi:hypothetical protein
MKKYIPLLLVVCFFASSCKKNNHSGTDPNTKTYNVKFALNGFTQSIESAPNSKVKVNSVKTNATPVPVTSDYFKVIYYLIGGVDNSISREVKIDSTAVNFGTITDNLPAGTYNVGIIAGQAGLNYPDYPQGIFYVQSGISGTAPWKDTFMDKFQLTVSGDVNQNVTLNRIVAQLQLNIEDAIPAAVKSIVITIKNEYLYYLYPTEQPDNPSPVTFTTIIPDLAKGKTNFKINKIMNNTIIPFIVTINCYDANKNSIGSGITINNVTCQKNTRTILSGKLFSGASNNTFTVGLNDWDPTPIVVQY